MFRKILIPVDLNSPEANELATRMTLEFSRNFDADLRLVYAQLPDLIALSDYGLVDPEDRLRRKAEAEISKLIESFNYRKERISIAIRFGGVSWEILTEADEWSADLIALASHHPRFVTYLFGSNAATIVKYAKCSVLVIRESGIR